MTFKLAVFGNPVEHSRSPEIHAAFAAAAGIDIDYRKVLVPEGAFEAIAGDFMASGGHGFNATVPVKADAFRYVHERSDIALTCGAVNTVSRVAGGLRGDNTDGVGIVADMTQNLGWQVTGASVLIAGAGGATRGVLPLLAAARPACLHIINRTRANAVTLAGELGLDALTVVDHETALEGYDLVINATSAGLGGGVPSLPGRVIGRNTMSYDMIYGAGETAFNAWASSLGAGATADGLGMLVEQAAEAFRLWFPAVGDLPTRDVISSTRQTING